MTEQPRKNKSGRPPNPMPEPIPDTPENVARSIMKGPPKGRWRFEDERPKDQADS